MPDLRRDTIAALRPAVAGNGQISFPFPIGGRPRSIPYPLVSALVFLALALAMHFVQIGNPVIHVDEEFYLLVANRMADGAIPYVDIWDRKPIGLFLLYRLFVALPGDGVATYQLFGIASCAVTALVIERMAREIATPVAARLAGIAYILYLPIFSYGIGQAPVFYNLPVALAAFWTMQAFRHPDAASLIRYGMVPMALMGVAIQIKYSAVFEGVALGLLLLVRGWSDAWPWKRLGIAALAWSAMALLPTMLALGVYAAIGHADAFLQANFLSIFQRLPDGPVSWVRLAKEVAALTPFWLAILLGGRRLSRRTGIDRRAELALRVWGIAAVLGFLVFGTWYDHYVAPILPPLAVLAAPALGRSAPGQRWYTRLLLGFGAVAGMVVMIYQISVHGTVPQVQHFAAQVRSEMHGGCAWFYDGEPAFYPLTGSCLPTRYPFPNHLNTWTEAPALGIDPDREVARIMMSRPDVVVFGEWRKLYLPNYRTRAIVQDFLARDYVHYRSVRLGSRTYGLWKRRGG